MKYIITWTLLIVYDGNTSNLSYISTREIRQEMSKSFDNRKDAIIYLDHLAEQCKSHTQKWAIGEGDTLEWHRAFGEHITNVNLDSISVK